MIPWTKLRTAAIGLLLGSLAAVQPARAEYPEKPVQIIVNAAPGGAADSTTRRRIPVHSSPPVTAAVGADSNLSHRAGRILSQGWKPTLRWSAVDKCRFLPGLFTSLRLH